MTSAFDLHLTDEQRHLCERTHELESAQEAVDVAVQVHGASGLERGHPLEHLYREVRAPRIYEGASEIQREIIARGPFRGARRREAVAQP